MRAMVEHSRQDAAIAIQAAIRGKLGRAAARARKVAVIRSFMDVQRQHLAAAIIQSAFFRKMYPESDDESFTD